MKLLVKYKGLKEMNDTMMSAKKPLKIIMQLTTK
jgi:hypothetical protein